MFSGSKIPLTLYQPMTHIYVMSSHKPIKIYMGGLILGVNTLYRLFCFFKLFPMVGKGLTVTELVLYSSKVNVVENTCISFPVLRRLDVSFYRMI